MEWSAGWYIRFRPAADEKSGLSAGVKVNGMRLEPGEVLALPDVHLGFFTGNFHSGTNALRRYLYESVYPRYLGEPVVPQVSYDHAFGLMKQLGEETMIAQATRAATLGVEVFVVDANWFAGDFPFGVGNWDRADPHRFPNGLEPLAEYVRELGMDFGLWFEPERATEGTYFHRQHPEWFVPCKVWDMDSYYHLNLAIREAQDYVIELVGGWIRRLDLRWSRWDYNIQPELFWENADPTLKVQFGYMEGLYRVLDTLMKEHPGWMVEQCAGGGKRIDISTMKRAHTYWFSDQTFDQSMCRYMQARANRFLPGHLLNSSVAVQLAGGDAGYDPMTQRGADWGPYTVTSILSRMLGKLSFDGDIASWSREFTERASRLVTEFKAARQLMVQDFYQLLPMPKTAHDWTRSSS